MTASLCNSRQQHESDVLFGGIVFACKKAFSHLPDFSAYFATLITNPYCLQTNVSRETSIDFHPFPKHAMGMLALPERYCPLYDR